MLAAERESLVATVVLMLVLIWNDELDAAKGVADGLLAAARPRGWASAVANGSFLRAMAQVRRGEVADAEADIRPAFEFKLAVSPPDSLAWALIPLVDTLVERDELDAAERALVAGSADVLTPDLLVFPQVMEARARLRLAQRRPEEALADARAAAASWELHGTDCPGMVGWRVCAVEALVALGDTAAARELADEQLALAERFGAAGPLGAALRAVARCCPPAAAIAPLERAVALLAATARRSSSTCARCVELGAALRRRGRREAAREPLREALHLADRGGAVRLAARAREELRAAGARPRRAALSGRDALDARRAPRRRAGRRGPHEPPDRPAAVRHPAHGGDAPHARVRQARRHVARPARRRAVAGRASRPTRSRRREAQDQLCRLERDVELRRVADAVEHDPVGVRQPVAGSAPRRAATEQAVLGAPDDPHRAGDALGVERPARAAARCRSWRWAGAARGGARISCASSSAGMCS